MEPKKKVGLKEIAKQLGVSTALVSYVLNGKKEDRIGKEIAEKIRNLAKELNYQPNQIAKSLKTQKTYTLGLIVADISNPFSSQIARVIEEEAKKNGYTVIFGSSDESLEKSRNLIDVLVNRQVDGIIIACSDNSYSLLEELEQKGIPFILIDRYYPDHNFSYIAIDNFKAAFNGVKHLLENGRKRIGFIGYKTSLFHLQERKRGYEEALKSQKIKPENSYIQEVELNNIESDVRAGIKTLLDLGQPVDALFFSTNTLAIYGLKFLASQRINIPENVAVVAFDEAEAYDLFYVPVTYIKQPIEEMGKKATQALLEKVDSKEKNIQIILDTELVVRESSK